MAHTLHHFQWKAQALLAYLAVTAMPQSRESLAALLWPESSAKRAHANLRRALWALTSDLGKEWFDVESDNISIKQADNIWIDVGEFRNFFDGWERHPHDEGEICAECLSKLNNARELYRDDLWRGFRCVTALNLMAGSFTSEKACEQNFPECWRSLFTITR